MHVCTKDVRIVGLHAFNPYNRKANIVLPLFAEGLQLVYNITDVLLGQWRIISCKCFANRHGRGFQMLPFTVINKCTSRVSFSYEYACMQCFIHVEITDCRVTSQ